MKIDRTLVKTDQSITDTTDLYVIQVRADTWNKPSFHFLHGNIPNTQFSLCIHLENVPLTSSPSTIRIPTHRLHIILTYSKMPYQTHQLPHTESRHCEKPVTSSLRHIVLSVRTNGHRVHDVTMTVGKMLLHCPEGASWPLAIVQYQANMLLSSICQLMSA